jgi:hypothetical protein
MNSKIQLINETEDGEIQLKAIYQESDNKPSYLVVEDKRERLDKEVVNMNFRYDRKTNVLVLISVNGTNATTYKEDVEDLVDRPVVNLIEELYEDPIEIRTWTARDKISRIVNDSLKRLKNRLKK